MHVIDRLSKTCPAQTRTPRPHPTKEVSVTSWIEDSDQNVLLVRQAAGLKLWTLPGGFQNSPIMSVAFSSNSGSLPGHVASQPMGLNAVLSPDPINARRTNTQMFGQPVAAPMGSSVAWSAPKELEEARQSNPKCWHLNTSGGQYFGGNEQFDEGTPRRTA